jgi:hypothetical protein
MGFAKYLGDEPVVVPKARKSQFKGKLDAIALQI